MIEHLPCVIETVERSGVGGADHPMRIITRKIAFEAGAWTKERADKVTAVFDGLAPEWHERNRPGRLDPLRDALARGGVPERGFAVELGSGTGLATSIVAERVGRVMAVDLSAEMLRRAPADAGDRVCADGARLPVRDASVDVMVLMNAFLFVGEVRRVLAPGGVIVWVCSNGDQTPIYLSAEDVDLALGDDFDGVASEAGTGTWSVHRRRSWPAGGPRRTLRP